MWRRRPVRVNEYTFGNWELDGDFYCDMLEENYDVLCRCLILDKPFFAQLLNNCDFNMTMIKQIKSQRVFRGKIQKLLDLLKDKIQVRRSYMEAFCECLVNVGQGPIAKHYNSIARKAHEKLHTKEKTYIKRQPGVFITNPNDDDFGSHKQTNDHTSPPADVYKSTPLSAGILNKPIQSRHESRPRYIQKDRGKNPVYKSTVQRIQVHQPGQRGREITPRRPFSDHTQMYGLFAFLVNRVENQDREIEKIKLRLQKLEIENERSKETIGQTLTRVRSTPLPRQQFNFTPEPSNLYLPLLSSRHELTANWKM